MKHTPEPWRPNWGSIMDNNCYVVAVTPDDKQATNLDSEWFHNRNRIVACVNGCAGLNPEVIQTMHSVLRRIMRELPQKRDWLDPDLEDLAQEVLVHIKMNQPQKEVES